MLRAFFLHFLRERFFYIVISVFSTFFSFVFSTFFSSFFYVLFFGRPTLESARAETSWRPPGRRLKSRIPLPQRFFYVFTCFLYVFYRNHSVPTFEANMPPGWEGGRRDWKWHRFFNVYLFVFPTFFTSVFSTFFSCSFYVLLRKECRKNVRAKNVEKTLWAFFTSTKYIYIYIYTGPLQ